MAAQLMRDYAAILAIQQATVAATEPFDLVISPVAPDGGLPRRVADAVGRG